MKAEKTSKATYTGVLILRTDTATNDALNELARLSERNKSDAVRYAIRQTVNQLSAKQKTAMKSAG